MDESHSAHPAGAVAAEKKSDPHERGLRHRIVPVVGSRGFGRCAENRFPFSPHGNERRAARFFRAPALFDVYAPRRATRTSYFPSYLCPMSRFNVSTIFPTFFLLNIIHRQPLPAPPRPPISFISRRRRVFFKGRKATASYLSPSSHGNSFCLVFG